MEFSMQEIFPLIEEGIKNGGEYRFYPKGISMLPLLREGIDSVILSAVEDIKKYDMILYLRDDGNYVLHRVVEIENNMYNLCGDNQCYIEKNIRKEQVKAVVTAFYRDNQYVSVNNKKYMRYAKKRVTSIPIRRIAIIIKSYYKRIKG